VCLNFNGDTTADYDRAYFFFGGYSPTGYQLGVSCPWVAYIPLATASYRYSGTITIEDYAGTTSSYRNFTAEGKTYYGSGPVGELEYDDWQSSAAITSITLSTTSDYFAAGTKISIYGTN
jgi:hypothetical protein